MFKKFLIGTLVVIALSLAGTAVASYDFGPTTLKVGSTGDYVKTLQTFVGASADGAFGPMTKAKVMAWQSSNGLTADGLFGNLSKAKANDAQSNFPAGCTSASGFSSLTGVACTSVNANTFAPAGCTTASGFSPVTGGACYAVASVTLPAGCTTTAGFSPLTGTSCGTAVPAAGVLAGAAGSISDLTKLSTYNDEKINEGDTGKVLTFEVKADNGSDLNLSSLKLKFTHANTGSYRMDRYMNNVAIYMGSTKVGTASVADFTKDTANNTYSGSIALTGVIVKAGQKVALTVELTANTTIDSVDQDSGNLNWTVETVSIRYNDATGAILTDSTVVSEVVAFTSITTSGDLALKLTEATSNPVAAVFTASETTTTMVPMLAVKLKAEGANQNITKLQFLAASTGVATGGTNLIVSDWELFNGATSIATYDATLSTADDASNVSGSVIFSGISGLTLTKDVDTTLTLKAKIKKIGTGSASASAFDQGDNLIASLEAATFADVALTLAETSVSGDTVATGLRSGTVAGKTQTFRSKGMNVAYVSSTAVKTVGDAAATTPTSDTADFSITFDVTAFGSDIYLDLTAPDETGTSTSAISDAGTGTLVASLTAANILTGTNGYQVLQGTTERFTINSHTLATASGYFKLSITDLMYALTDVDGDITYNTNLDAFKTSQLYLTDR